LGSTRNATKPSRIGFRFENQCAGKQQQQGHLCGTDLPARDKVALSEYIYEDAFWRKKAQKKAVWLANFGLLRINCGSGRIGSS